MKTSYVVVGIIVIVLIIGGVMLSERSEVAAPTEGEVGEAAMEDKEEGAMMEKKEGEAMMEKGDAMMAKEMAVTYTGLGFSPNLLTVKVGTKVMFENQSGREMWVASAVHPTHQELPGFDQGTPVAKGGTYGYTFNRVGTWKYHNHQNPGDRASVVVQ